MARRVFGYARVSSQEQALGTSLKDQQNAIAQHARRLGLSVTKFFVEAESGVGEKLERREQIRALMASVSCGDLVLCDKIDRWSRDPEFTWKSMREIREAGASAYFVGDACDPNTPDGDTTMHVRVLVAREEHKRIRLRMVGTRKHLRNDGYFVEGLPPFGYRRSHPKGYKGKEKNVLVIEPDEAETVRRIFRLYLGGMSMTRLAEKLDLKLDRVKDCLHRRLYTGEIQNAAKEWIAGKHPAIIDRRTFERAQHTIAARTLGGPRPRGSVSETSDWLLRDVARCACGTKMGAAYAGPKGDARRYYYRCLKGCRPYVPVRAVEADAAPIVLARLVELREEIGASADSAPKPKVTASVDIMAKLDAKRERVLELYADGLISRDEMQAKLGKVDADRARVEAERDAANDTSPLADTRVRRELLRNLRDLEKAWRRSPASVQREVVNLLASRATVAAGAEPAFEWHSPEHLAESIE